MNPIQPANAHSTKIIAVLSDIHYGGPSLISSRRTDIADILLLRAVHRLNRLVKPDVTVVLGDILDDGSAPDAPDKRRHIRTLLDKLESPVVVIPGNHDGTPESFYKDFKAPLPVEPLSGLRFLPFIDAEAPGYNATRNAAELTRFHEARDGFPGLLIALQHVCLFPPGSADIPYNYTNVQDIIKAMRVAGVTLSISGHYHEGADPIVEDGITFVNAPGLCEYPFRFATMAIDTHGIKTRLHQLALPEGYAFIDRHVHTQLAYCQENMDVEKAVIVGKAVGLAGIGFSEHSGQLYFPRDGYWGGDAYQTGMKGAVTSDNRMDAYWHLLKTYGNETIRFGLEVDIDFAGNLLLCESDRQQAHYLLGSIHSTPSIKRPGVPGEVIGDEFIYLLEQLLQQNMAAITHPFRVFRRAGLPAPESLFVPVAEMLAKSKTAAEINMHGNNPPLRFIKACLNDGVKFTLGSDAHNLYEVGEFAPHLSLLQDAGYDGDLNDILIGRDVGGFT